MMEARDSGRRRRAPLSIPASIDINFFVGRRSKLGGLSLPGAHDSLRPDHGRPGTPNGEREARLAEAASLRVELRGV